MGEECVSLKDGVLFNSSIRNLALKSIPKFLTLPDQEKIYEDGVTSGEISSCLVSLGSGDTKSFDGFSANVRLAAFNFMRELPIFKQTPKNAKNSVCLSISKLTGKF